jgi:dihydrofolate reductase
MKAMILAYGKNRVIGNEGKIPWMGRLPADMQRVQQLTTGQAIIMGRKTLESIGRALPNRQNIVITSGDSAVDGVEIAHSLDDAYSKVEPGRDSFIFGGQSVYEAALGKVSIIYATEIDQTFPGDSFFPQLDDEDWQITEKQTFPPDDDNKYSYSFVTYQLKT